MITENSRARTPQIIRDHEVCSTSARGCCRLEYNACSKSTHSWKRSPKGSVWEKIEPVTPVAGSTRMRVLNRPAQAGRKIVAWHNEDPAR